MNKFYKCLSTTVDPSDESKVDTIKTVEDFETFTANEFPEEKISYVSSESPATENTTPELKEESHPFYLAKAVL